MSVRWVESTKPVVNEAALLATLKKMGMDYAVSEDRITFSNDTHLSFFKRHGAWILRRIDGLHHRQWARRFGETLPLVEEQLREEERLHRQQEERSRRQDALSHRLDADAESRRAAEAALAEAEARRRLVEGRRQDVLSRARELGYCVQEERQGNEIRLVLVRRTY